MQAGPAEIHHSQSNFMPPKLGALPAKFPPGETLVREPKSCADWQGQVRVGVGGGETQHIVLC